MKKEIALAVVVVACISGFLLGRNFPAHHYQPLGNALLYDTATGKVGDPFKGFNQRERELAQGGDSSKPSAYTQAFDAFPPCD